MIAVVMVAFVYALGVAGNRVVEVLYDKANISYHQTHTAKPYAALEREVRTRGEIHRDWLERHKTYRKILRAASASSLIFLFSAMLYSFYHAIMPGKRRLLANEGPYCVISLVFLGFFTLAYLSEDAHFKRDLIDYASDFQPHEQKGSPSPTIGE